LKKTEILVINNRMQIYQKEQRDTLDLIRRHLNGNVAENIEKLREEISNYLDFRKEVDAFLSAHFSHVCTQSCYQSNRSACCTKEGIITFFADAVVNALVSEPAELDTLQTVLSSPHIGNKCIYLGQLGCLWRVKPLVCEMFLCDQAESTVFSNNESLRDIWQEFRQREKRFRWPDQPVLFDALEAVFIQAGHSSPLMYLHNSPGLLKVKEKSEKSQKK
jgi:hypothetical protein